MNPEELQLWNNAIEAIKLIGVAFASGVAAAVAGYLTARLQLKTRLKELDKNNEFKAREHYFSHFQKYQEAVDALMKEHYPQLEKELISFGQQGSERRSRLVFEYRSELFGEVADQLKTEVKNRKLIDTYQFKNLVDAEKAVKAIPEKGDECYTVDDVKKLIGLLRHIDLCAHMITQNNLHKTLGVYWTPDP